MTWDELWESLAEEHPEWDEYDIDGHIRTNYVSVPQDGVRVWILAQ